MREASVCFTLSLIFTMLTQYLDLGLLAYENLDIKWILEVKKSAPSHNCDLRLTATHVLPDFCIQIGIPPKRNYDSKQDRY